MNDDLRREIQLAKQEEARLLAELRNSVIDDPTAERNALQGNLNKIKNRIKHLESHRVRPEIRGPRDD